MDAPKGHKLDTGTSILLETERYHQRTQKCLYLQHTVLQHTVFQAFSVNLPFAELSGVQKDLVGLGAINVHNETHSAGISVRTKTNNLTFEDLFLKKRSKIFKTRVSNPDPDPHGSALI
jgi:hypothetical protein